MEKIILASNNKHKIKEFVCFKLGDGLQKRNDDFAAEVAAQVNK